MLVCVFSLSEAAAQPCTALGQNPNTAYPICGATSFTQNQVAACTNSAIPTGTYCLPGTSVSVNRPFWYRFTCYQAGTLGFTLNPIGTVDEDYDWQIFDITNRNPNDVFTDQSMMVVANWAGTYGPTGASAAGTAAYTCGSDPNDNVSTFSVMPNLIQGHEYLLLISHYTQNELGYTLSFQGGTASIVNPIAPLIQKAYAVCDGTEALVILNKRIDCKSIAADGSDFTINGPAGVNIISASGSGCNNNFDSDTIMLRLSGPLSPGNYTVTAKTGSDGNTLLDNCGTGLAVGASVKFNFIALVPTPLDSIKPVTCIKDTLELVFSKPMDCNTIAADGSDFLITGPSAVTIRKAEGICVNGVTTTIRLILAAPIRTNGQFTIRLVNGSDGNTIVDECGMTTPANSTIHFTTANITDATVFTAVVRDGCKSDTLLLGHNGNGNANKWNWTLDDGKSSTQQNPVMRFNAFGNRDILLTVTNGICTDTARKQVVLPDITIKAVFNSKDTLCPTDTLQFTDVSRSVLPVQTWQWNFGNGTTSAQQTPPAQRYPLNVRQTRYPVRLIASNGRCADTTSKNILVLNTCYVAVPTAFTPNGDGLNDYLYPLNAYKAADLRFLIYNRYGQVLFEAKEWPKKWDGRVNNVPQPSGTYVWALEYTDKDTGKKVAMKGTTVLIR